MFEQHTANHDATAIRFFGMMNAEDGIDRRERIGVCIDITGLSNPAGDALVVDTTVDLIQFSHNGSLEHRLFISDRKLQQAGPALPWILTTETVTIAVFAAGAQQVGQRDG